MTDSAEKTLAIKITPKLDIDELTKQIKAAVDAALKTGELIPKPGEEKGGTSGKRESTKKEGGAGGQEGDKKADAIHSVGQIAKTGFNLAQQTFNGIFGIIKDLHARVKQSSAFLASVENLFNLAVTLLLMPLGNAIADTILPATVELVENVVSLWSKFEEFAGNGDLKSIIYVVLHEGIELIGNYLKDIGNIFTDTGDTLLGAIGNLFKWLGGLLESGKLGSLLETLFSIFSVFVENMGVWIPLIIGYQTAMLGATIGAAGAGAAGWLPGAGATAAAIGATAGFSLGFGASYAYLNAADGAMIPHTTGGQTIRVAEHENEYIVPESKMNLGGTSGGNNYYVTINGYTSEEVKQYVRDVIHDEISGSQYRSGI